MIRDRPLGKLYYRTGQDGSAVRAFHAALCNSPPPQSLLSLLKDMNKALRGLSALYRDTKTCELGSGELKEIKKTLTRFKSINTITPQMVLAVGRIELLSGNQEAALAHFKTLFNMDSLNVEAFAEAGSILAERGQRGFDEIEALANQSIWSLTVPKRIMVDGGLMYDRSFYIRGNFQKRNKAIADILFIKGHLYEDKGRERYAIHNYQASIYTNPVEPSSYEALARCLENLGDNRAANEWYNLCSNIYFYLHLDHKAVELKTRAIHCAQKIQLPTYGYQRDLAKMYLLAEEKIIKDSKPLKDVDKAMEYIESAERDMKAFYRQFGVGNVNKYKHDHLSIYCLASYIYGTVAETIRRQRTEQKITKIVDHYHIASEALRLYRSEAKILKRR